MKSLYELDYSTVPFYENQEGTIRDLHQLDSIYGVKNLEKRDDLFQQAISISCEKNLIEESQGTLDLVSPASRSLFENCTKKTPQFKRLTSMAAIADSSEQSSLDIIIQRQSPRIVETPTIANAPTKNKLKLSDRVLFFEDDAGEQQKLLPKLRIKLGLILIVCLCVV